MVPMGCPYLIECLGEIRPWEQTPHRRVVKRSGSARRFVVRRVASSPGGDVCDYRSRNASSAKRHAL